MPFCCLPPGLAGEGDYEGANAIKTDVKATKARMTSLRRAALNIGMRVYVCLCVCFPLLNSNLASLTHHTYACAHMHTHTHIHKYTNTRAIQVMGKAIQLLRFLRLGPSPTSPLLLASTTNSRQRSSTSSSWAGPTVEGVPIKPSLAALCVCVCV